MLVLQFQRGRDITLLFFSSLPFRADLVTLQSFSVRDDLASLIIRNPQNYYSDNVVVQTNDETSMLRNFLSRKYQTTQIRNKKVKLLHKLKIRLRTHVHPNLQCDTTSRYFSVIRILK